VPVAAFLVAAVLVAAAFPVGRGLESPAGTRTVLVAALLEPVLVAALLEPVLVAAFLEPVLVAALLGPPAAFLGGPGVDRVVVLVTLLVACDFGREAVERLSPLDRRVLGRD